MVARSRGSASTMRLSKLIHSFGLVTFSLAPCNVTAESGPTDTSSHLPRPTAFWVPLQRNTYTDQTYNASNTYRRSHSIEVYTVYDDLDIPAASTGCNQGIQDMQLPIDSSDWSDCISTCSSYNQGQHTAKCSGVSFHDSKCWLKLGLDEINSCQRSWPGATSAILHLLAF